MAIGNNGTEAHDDGTNGTDCSDLFWGLDDRRVRKLAEPRPGAANTTGYRIRRDPRTERRTRHLRALRAGRNWPKPMSDSLPNHEKFTWSTTMDVFAESPNRVFLVQKGELARIDKRPETKWIPEFGPGLSIRFSVCRCGRPVPARAATRSTRRPMAGLVSTGDGNTALSSSTRTARSSRTGRSGTSSSRGRMTCEISPYDPEKNVWVVDAEGHAVYKFSNDGKKLLLTLGTPRLARRRRHALQSADLPRLHGREHDVPGRRVRRHAGHQVRHERKEADAVGTEGHAAA